MRSTRPLRGFGKLPALLVVLLLAAACTDAAETTTTDTTEPGDVTTTASPVTTAPPDTQPAESTRLVVSEPIIPSTIDPHGPLTEDRHIYMYAEGLTAVNAAAEVVPNLAESWEISPDGLEYTFNLRDGVQFHNGDSLTAEDVVWSIERVMDPDLGAREQEVMATNIASMDVIDSLTLRITLNGVFAPFLGSLADTFILSPDSEIDPATGLTTNPIGTGPFTFVEWTPDQRVLLSKFDSYWEPGIPTYDEFELVALEEDARLAALRAGDIDAMFGYPAAQLAAAAADPDIDVEFDTASRWWAYSFNVKAFTPPFDNPEVRRAIALALNKEEVVLLSTFGAGQVTNDFFAEGQFWNLGVPDPYAEADVETARELLAENGAEGAQIRLIGTTDFGLGRPMFVLEEQLTSLGFDVSLEMTDFTTLADRLENDENWDMSSMIIGFKLDPERNFAFYEPDRGDSRFLGGGWPNEEFLAILEQARSITDPDERKALYSQAYQMMLDEVPTIMFANDSRLWGVRSNVQNFVSGTGIYHSPDSGFARVTITETN